MNLSLFLFQINVLDCNDHAPVFEMPEYEASVREGASPGTTVLTLKATDQDFGKNAEVSFKQIFFNLWKRTKI